MMYDKKEKEDRSAIKIPTYSVAQSSLEPRSNGRWLSKEEVKDALEWCLNHGCEADCVSISRVESLINHLS